jgi:DNA repair protein RecN (Recombination protein N)
MLELLKIRNIALIESLEVNFAPGLNVLTGETGAGKSIVVDSIDFVLGGRADKDLIRTGCEFAEVEALISVSGDDRNKGLIEYMDQAGIGLDEARSLILCRRLNTAGKNVCRVNGKIVTVGMLREISAFLIDIHGQHEHQSLLDPNRHIELLDRLCGAELAAVLESLTIELKRYKEQTKEIKALSQGGADLIEVYRHQISEMESARLTEGEEGRLSERRRIAAESQRLTEAIGAVSALLAGNDGEGGALDLLAQSVSRLDGAVKIDSRLNDVYDELYAIHERLCAAAHSVSLYAEGLAQSEPLDSIEERLELIHGLKRKYGADVGQILARLGELKQKVEDFENSGDLIKKLNEERKVTEREIAAVCAKASRIRKAAAERVSADIEGSLRGLGMGGAEFGISVERRNEFTPSGFDRVEFMISPNLGEPKKPLTKIASGGEISRVMLALKASLAQYDCIDTFIFDEIDSGVSGRAAHMVALKLALIARTNQILCITHLPQIAAMADAHYSITKADTPDGKTVTEVRGLNVAAAVEELARLIGGAEITETTRRSAAEMKGQAVRERSRGVPV